MARPELIGISSTIRESEVSGLTDDEQNDVIKREGERLTGLLRKFVADTPPLGGLALLVKGPFDDPLQGKVHVHTVCGHFDLDALPTDSDAYKVHVLKAVGVTAGNDPNAAPSA